MSSAGTLILALLLHPEVQKKAQAELDRVVGQERLPTLEDEPNLPYITAIFREGMRSVKYVLLCLCTDRFSFRWRPVGPLGEPKLRSH